MKKYKIISNIIETGSNNSKSSVIGCYDNDEEAKSKLASIYNDNRFNSEIRDIFFDGNSLNMFNTSINCYSSYKIKEIIE